MQYIQRHFLLYAIIILTIFFLAASYYRFMVIHDHLISYEGDCDPASRTCFVYCEDDACAEPFYYSIIERHANYVYDMCGPDVTQCEEAYTCKGDNSCSITYCDPEINDELCEDIDNEG